MDDNQNVATAFLCHAGERFAKLRILGGAALDQLEPGDWHNAGSATDNSIAVIIKHLHGNMVSRWTDFLTSDGNKPWRNRDAEFESSGQETPQQIRAWWDEGWNLTLAALSSLRPEDLLREVSIRGVPLTVMDAILRQLGHYSYHVGQLVYLARTHRGAAWNSLSIEKGKSEHYVARPGD